MVEKMAKLKGHSKRILYVFLIMALLCVGMIMARLSIAIGVEAEDVKVKIEAGLEKYINYASSDQDKGTLVQYKLKSGIEYEENQENIPIKESEITVGINQIDEKYPQHVKVIAKNEQEAKYEYNATAGTVVIKPAKNEDKSEYVIMCYYDTYTQENLERELSIKVSGKYIILAKEDEEIYGEGTLENTVTENIGTLTSLNYNTSDIYNGYIKSNKINGTTYNTSYTEKAEIIVSKKEAQENLQITENNTFVEKQTIEDLGNNNELVYKSTKIKKQEIQNLLGKEGTIEISDLNNNIIITINKDTEFDDNGELLITYENEIQGIVIKTSKIQNEGILNFEHTKEIKNTMLNIDNISIKTTSDINGEIKENIIEIKDSQTTIDMKVNPTTWTNEYQNEVVFDISLDSNTVNTNLLKNPTLKIDLPSEVEKIILGNSSIVYANGLILEEPFIQTNENRTFSIIANLKGEQKQYKEDELELVTDVKISATIILKKDIEATQEKAVLSFTNEYVTAEKGTKDVNIEIESYEEIAPKISEEKLQYNTANIVTTQESDKMKMEIAPVKGDQVLNNGDTVYEGEFIKYNIKITNISDETINNVKVIGTIPEGVTYGELEADYFTAIETNYHYNFDETVKTKEIEIGTLKSGQSVEKFYEVKVKDLANEEIEILSNIKGYIENEEVANYEIRNIVKQAEVQIFLSSLLDNRKDKWNYDIELVGTEGQTVDVQIKLPEIYSAQTLVDNGNKIYLEEEQISSDNIVTLNDLIIGHTYSVQGLMDSAEIEGTVDGGETIVTAVATVSVNDKTYKSNENRILFTFPTASITMTSSNEGEEVKYGEEINYEITVKNIGRTNINDDDFNTISVNVLDYLPEEVDPISVTYMKQTFNEENKLIAEEEVTEDISGKLVETNTNKELANIDISLCIPYEESRTIKIKTTAGFVFEKTQIENSATVEGIGEEQNISLKTSNKIIHTILPYNYEETDEPINPEDPSNPSNPDDPEDPENPVNPDDTNKIYSVSGIAWLDENEDGQRQNNENTISGIQVMLIDTKTGKVAKDTSENLCATKTNSDGSYTFENVKPANYIVIFVYDEDRYSLTQYQAKGVSSEYNSDVTNKTITIQEEARDVGATDIITLNENKTNIDMGLVENKVFDLKLDKYLSKITVDTQKSSKQIAYSNTQLAKVEIKSKEIEGATVTIEYDLVIRNEGEIDATVEKVVDYLPEGLEFSTTLNKEWTKKTNGEVVNTSLANQKIKAGESVTLKLIATKKMTADTTGTYTNKAEIEEASNILRVEDISTKDNSSQADVIITIGTGIVTLICIILTSLTILAVGIFLIYKYGIAKIGKSSLFLLMFITLIISQTTSVNAEEAPSSATFINTHVRGQGPNFSGGPGNQGAVCIEHGVWAYSGVHYLNTTSGIATNLTSESKTDINFTLTKKNNDITVKQSGSYYIFGPFEVECKDSNGNNYDNGYSIQIFDTKGSRITKYQTCDANGSSKSVRGTSTFYLKIQNSLCKNGLARVTITTSKSGTHTKTYTNSYNGFYKAAPEVGGYYFTVTNKWGGYETAGPNAQDIQANMTFTTSWSESQAISNSKSVTWTSFPATLEIIKKDADNSNLKLKGVQINVKCTAQNYNKTFTTDSNGRIYIDNLKQGTYTITEVSNPNYGYGNDSADMASTSITLRSGNIKSCILTNTRKYITLEGYVWEDKYWGTGKNTTANELYKNETADKNDKLLKGVTVKLKNSSGSVVKTATTDAYGKYSFTDVKIDDLSNLYIEFTYDGMSYQNVSVKTGNANGNKASEGSARTTFNNNYTTITSGKSNAYTLKYNLSNNVSKIDLGDETKKSNYPVNWVDSQYLIQATTYNGYGGYLSKIKSAESIRADGTEVISNINLGLKEREQPDLSLVKDLESAKVSVNGYEHVYKYADRFTNIAEHYNMEPQVKFGQERGSQSYTRALYASDIQFTGDKKLEVNVTYKIGIKNNSTGLSAKVNEITDYFDSKYEFIKAGTEINADGTIKTSVTNGSLASYNSEYQKITINPNLTIGAQGEGVVYVQFKVKPENFMDILDRGEEVKLDNVTEITSYSILDKNGNTYAGIDIDSQPGNLKIEDKKTWEDDTDMAPGLLLVLQEERSTSGTVFEDETEDGLKTGEVRQGSGSYEEGEHGIEGITVTLKNEDGTTAKVYKEDTKEWVEGKGTTDANGNYTISGYAPGKYYIEYTWGGQTYNDTVYTVQNYKGTVVNKESYNAKNSNELWYKETNPRYSDAVDNYETRKQVDEETKDFTYKLKQDFENAYEEKFTNKTMTSVTPKFKVNIEYAENSTEMREEFEPDFKNTIKNIDFGISRRAKQVVSLEKQIKNVKVTLSDGTTLINAEFDDNGKLIGQPKYITAEGIVKLEVDDEIVQGANLEVTYNFKVANISELDYANSDFYYYGKGYGQNESEFAKLSSTKIIDYLNETSGDTDSRWKILNETEINNDYLGTYLSEGNERKEQIKTTDQILMTEGLKTTQITPLGNNTAEIELVTNVLLADNEEILVQNTAEIIQVEKSYGAMLETIPGNYIPGASNLEHDDSEAQEVTILPPTGLTNNIIAYTILAISSLGILVVGIILIKKFIIK